MKEKLKKLIIKKRRSDYILYTLVIFAGVFLDQLTKFLAVKFIEPVGDIPIIEEVLHLEFYTNPGAAFGSMADKPYIFKTMSVIIIIGMLLYLYLGYAESVLSGIACALIISGGIGNMIDRTLYGEVTDFISFRLIDFAIFNGADSFVCVGSGLLVLALILEIKKEHEKIKAEKENKEKENEEGKEG